MYKTSECNHINTMLEKLSICPIDETDYCMRYIKHMELIVYQMLNDGHHFEKPEYISANLQQGICSLEDNIEESTVVRARGLPWQCTDQDVAKFFRGLDIEKGGVALCLSTQGRRNGEALVRFSKVAHRELALRRHKHHIGQRYIEVYKASGRDFLNVAGELSICPIDETDYCMRYIKHMELIVYQMLNDGHHFEKPEYISANLQQGICSLEDNIEESTVVRARGLPWQCTDQDVAKFFRGLDIEKGGVALCLSTQGRRNGEALVRFSKVAHRELALRRHKHHIGQRYIEVYKASGRDFLNVAGALRRHKHHIGQRYIEVYKASGRDFLNVAGGSNSEAQAFLQRDGQVIIRMRGLPFDATAKDVVEFFTRGDLPTATVDGEEGVLFVHYPDGRSTGDAFVMVKTENEASQALLKHKETMGARYIELFRSTTAEVQQVS
ncbi:unnamed protein product, partial [Adineta steineri]